MSTSFDKLDDDLPSIDTVPEEVELHIDMFTPVMQNRILREGDGGLVVHHQGWWVSFHAGQLTQQPVNTPTQLGMPLWPLLRTLPRT